MSRKEGGLWGLILLCHHTDMKGHLLMDQVHSVPQPTVGNTLEVINNTSASRNLSPHPDSRSERDSDFGGFLGSDAEDTALKFLNS